jgi:protein phosphatase
VSDVVVRSHHRSPLRHHEENEESPLKARIGYRQIRGAPPQQQDALLMGDTVLQGDDLGGETDDAPPLILGVADGVASTPQAERLSARLLLEIAHGYRQDGAAFNARLIRRAQTQLVQDVRAGRLKPSSACTGVLAEVKNDYVTVLNTGDSRAYLIDRLTGELCRLSKDHTAFQLLKDEGELPADAQDRDYGNVATGLLEAVTAAPMADQDFQVHMDYARLRDSQLVLLCSDGVTAHLSDDEIAAEVVAADGAGADPAASIVARVHERGASDNTTVIAAQPSAKSVRDKRSEARC